MNYAVRAASRPRRRYTPRKQARLADFVQAIQRRSDALHVNFKSQLRARDAGLGEMFEEWVRSLEHVRLFNWFAPPMPGSLSPLSKS